MRCARLGWIIPACGTSLEMCATSNGWSERSQESQAIEEIHRCAKTYIWESEYYADGIKQVSYRGHEKFLWKMDYAREDLGRFKDMELVRERYLPYLENQNVDTMFLLRKKR